MKNDLRRILIRAGTAMYCRDGHVSRARKDHEVLALPTTSDGGEGEDAWSFRRGFGMQTTYWYVLMSDVAGRDVLETRYAR